MKENRGSNGLLLLFDAIGLLITTVALMLIFSKVTNVLDSNTVIASLFFFGIKVLIVGIADVIGIGKKLIIGILFTLIADTILLAINLIMVLGIGNKLLLISAGADLVIVVLIRIIRNSVCKKQANNDPTELINEHSEDFFDIPSFDNNANAAVSSAEKPDSLSAVNSIPDTNPMNGEQPVINEWTGKKKDSSDTADTAPQIDSNFFEDSAVPPTEPVQDVPLNTETPASWTNDVPNLNALDSFFDEPLEESTDKTAESETYEDETATVDSLTQEMSRRIQELHSKMDDLEAWEAELNKREQAWQLSRKKNIEVSPHEVVLDDTDSEIIIDEEDLALLKAFLRQHPEI